MIKQSLEEKSAGGVVFRRKSTSKNQLEGCEFLIGKHSGYHKWVLPKGLVERGESDQEAAVREVMEEVGVEAQIVGMMPVKTIEYYYYADMGEISNRNLHTEDTVRRVKRYQEDGGVKTRVHKKVTFYLMELQKDLGQVGWEMEDRQWVSYEEGMKILDFETERDVFEAAKRAIGASGQN